MAKLFCCPVADLFMQSERFFIELSTVRLTEANANNELEVTYLSHVLVRNMIHM